MTDQLHFDLGAVPGPPPPPLEAAFREWLASRDGRLVYAEVVRRARELKARGIEHYGIAALFEAIRYDRTLELGRDVEGFRLNHNHRSRLARLVMEREPDLADFFETRRLEDEDEP